MEKYNEKCPICGTINKDLNLEETNGWFECEKCKNVLNSLHIKFLAKQFLIIKTEELPKILYE